jgi:predicted dehydrogenase
MKNLNVDIIGTGNILTMNTQDNKKILNVNVITVGDINEERAKKYAEK